MTAPLISVIMATWGRGRHILPSIQSVLNQRFRKFELIVVGDACTDETEAVVAGLADQGVRWVNLVERCGSQSAPNNAGIAAARGEVIAYLGHDDIWAPEHLERVARLFQTEPSPDFVVSGLIAHNPDGVPGSEVFGLFTDDSDKHRHFCPPSCFAHRKAAIGVTGPWRMPMEVQAPVDDDLLLRAVAADLRFGSTGVVTVHKFTAGLRYLSYLWQDSVEQAAMLAELDTPGHAARIARIMTESRRMGMVMRPRRTDYADLPVGEIARRNAARRGLLRPALQPLGRGAVLRQRPGPCAFDWSARPLLGIRLHGQNPRPRFLLPYAAGKVAMTIRVVHPDRAALGSLALLCNGLAATAVPVGLRPGLFGWTARYRAVVQLSPDQPSVLEILLSPSQRRKIGIGWLKLGFGIGRVRLRPIKDA